MASAEQPDSMKKVLMVLTNAAPDADNGIPGGWYLPEALHPYTVFRKAGFDVTFASPKGGATTCDPGSGDPTTAPELHKQSQDTAPLATVKGTDFAAVFLVGGFGVMYDFTLDAELQRVVRECYEAGGVASGVCHGPVGLVNVTLGDGSYLVAGKEVVAFNNLEEEAAGKAANLPKHGEASLQTCEDLLGARGAKFIQAAPWSCTVAQQDRVVTGQNPQSAEAVALAVAAVLGYTPPKQVLMVLTNAAPDADNGIPGGWYLPEALHPYTVFRKAGFDVTFASPKGGATTCDPGSGDPTTAPELHKQSQDTAPLATVKGTDFAAVFLVGGFGVMYDFTLDAELQRVVRECYEAGGVASGVCHGPVGLVNVTLGDGSYLVAGKEVVAFNNLEEEAAGKAANLPKHGEASLQTCEDLLGARGAKFIQAAPWSCTVAQQDRVVTGQNPQSAEAVALAVAAVLGYTPPKQVLMVLTNAAPDADNGIPGGWYLPEALHPYTVFRKAGFDVTFASPKGGATTCDPGSGDPTTAPELHKQSQDTAPLATVKGTDFAAVFLVGGFGVMYDFTLDAELQRVVRECYEAGGVASGVCHGPVGLVNVTLGDGSYLVAGKEVVAFNNLEEEAAGKAANLPKHGEAGLQTCEDLLGARGAKFIQAAPWSCTVAQQDRVVTGQNPQSAEAVALAVAAELNED